jgi:hypothetical protein
VNVFNNVAEIKTEKQWTRGLVYFSGHDTIERKAIFTIMKRVNRMFIYIGKIKMKTKGSVVNE